MVDDVELARFICSRFKTNMTDATTKVSIFLHNHGSLVTRTEVKKQECAMHDWVLTNGAMGPAGGYVCNNCGRSR